MIDAYLVRRRELEVKDKLSDAGDERLFTDRAIKDLQSVAKKLGTTESERMQTPMRTREALAKKQRRKPTK